MRNIGIYLVIIAGVFLALIIATPLALSGVQFIFDCSGTIMVDEIVCSGPKGEVIEDLIQSAAGGSFILTLVGGPIALLLAVLGFILKGLGRIDGKELVSKVGGAVVLSNEPKLTFYGVLKWIVIGVLAYPFVLFLLSLV